MSPRPLHEIVRSALKDYIQTLEGDDPTELYAMVMREVERPLLECALQHCEGNQTRAAQCLGLNRGTLRKKLREHGLNHDTAQDLT
jgi:Fis family transcriptional regulator